MVVAWIFYLFGDSLLNCFWLLHSANFTHRELYWCLVPSHNSIKCVLLFCIVLKEIQSCSHSLNFVSVSQLFWRPPCRNSYDSSEINNLHLQQMICLFFELVHQLWLSCAIFSSHSSLNFYTGITYHCHS